MNALFNQNFKPLKPWQLVKNRHLQKLLLTSASIATLVASNTEPLTIDQKKNAFDDDEISDGEGGAGDQNETDIIPTADTVGYSCDYNAPDCVLDQVASNYLYDLKTPGQAVKGTAENDRFYISGTNDWVEYKDVAILYDGDGGENTLDFSGRDSNVTVDLDQQKIDFAPLDEGVGAVGVLNFVNIVGSEYNDGLTGDDQDNVILGKGGLDTLYGRGGNDYLSGGDGSDVLFGEDGDDILYGGASGDGMYGGAGNDTMYGGAGNETFSGSDHNIIFGGSGTDVLRLKEGATTKYVVNFVGNTVTVNEFVSSVSTGASYQLNSVEKMFVVDLGGSITGTIDIKNIYTDLETADQALFTDNNDFLSWLGNDAGYNYEGL